MDNNQIDKKNLVTLRGANPGDRNFILATALRGLYYGDSWFKEIPKDIFMTNYHRVIERLIDNPDALVTIACLKDDPEVILGYSITRDVDGAAVLDYIFVKSAWRNIGIGKTLTPKDLKVVTHLTKVGAFLLKSNFPGVVFNPFII